MNRNPVLCRIVPDLLSSSLKMETVRMVLGTVSSGFAIRQTSEMRRRGKIQIRHYHVLNKMCGLPFI
jgi:hypothetical protein